MRIQGYASLVAIFGVIFVDGTDWSIVDISYMKEFFSSSYIKMMKGVWEKGKPFAEKGFNSAWNWTHFHHICVKDGLDGLVLGIDGNVETPWKEGKKNPELYFSFDEWNSHQSVGKVFVCQNPEFTYYI